MNYLILAAMMATNSFTHSGTNSSYYYNPPTNFSTLICSNIVVSSTTYSKPKTITFAGREVVGRIVASNNYQPICIYMDSNNCLGVCFIDEKGNPRVFKNKVPMIEIKEIKK